MAIKIAKGKTLKEMKEIIEKETKENEGLTSTEIVRKKKKEKPYCLKCQSGTTDFFYKSRNINHSNGWLPYCKNCLSGIFEDYYKRLHGDIYSSLYLLCRLLDVPFKTEYADNAIERNNNDVENKRSTGDLDVFKVYMTILNNKLKSVTNDNISFDDSDLYIDAIKKVHSSSHFDFDLKLEMIKEKNKDNYKEQQMLDELRIRFGEQYEDTELLWLKNDFDNWAGGHRVDTVALVNMVEDICRQRLHIRQQRAKGVNDLKKDFDVLNSLITNAALSPKDNKTRDDGANKLTIGMTIKQLEETRPADDPELKKKFGKWDNIDELIELDYLAPLLQSLGMTENSSVTKMVERNVKEGLALSTEDLQQAGVMTGEEDTGDE